MTVAESEITAKVEVATFIDGPKAGQKVEGPFVEGLLYSYDDVEYVCDTTFEGRFILYENRDSSYDLLVSMLPGFYF